jgi:DNA (cytosine-5)-methyltransferase 1
MNNDNCKKMTAISLFSSAGIGDLSLNSSGFDVLVANELISERAEIFSCNFPETLSLVGDIWEQENKIIAETKRLLAGRTLDVLFATPPCQGMSKNGRGKLLNSIRKGDKPIHDERNRLIIPCMNIAVALKPRFFVMENVPELENTVIIKNDNPEDVIFILDYVAERLGSEYKGVWEVVEFADYGVPQRRQRLITVFSWDVFVNEYMQKFKTVLPERTHAKIPNNGKLPWLTVRGSIAGLPPLDAGSQLTCKDKNNPFHQVPLLDKDKYFWVSNTPPEKGAFDNQCINPICLCKENPIHSAAHNEEGINRASQETPLYCIDCGEILPRPWVKNGADIRLMKGFTSAYKRMNWDLPSSTLTRNLSYACSDNKLHPDQHRVLSLYEAMLLHTITDFNYKWQRTDGKRVSDKLIREAIGESIPPRGLKAIFKHLMRLAQHDYEVMTERHSTCEQLSLL